MTRFITWVVKNSLTRMPGVALTRSTSCAGTETIRSTSPAIRLETRVVASGIARKMMVSTSGLPCQ